MEEGNNEVRDAFLDLGAKEVLQSIAGKHQGSVDEAYAALRDLGCPASLVRIDAGGGGANVERAMVFGGKNNSNFRPVFEESRGMEDAVAEYESKVV